MSSDCIFDGRLNIDILEASLGGVIGRSKASVRYQNYRQWKPVVPTAGELADTTPPGKHRTGQNIGVLWVAAG
jgi:hypothetical protein